MDYVKNEVALLKWWMKTGMTLTCNRKMSFLCRSRFSWKTLFALDLFNTSNFCYSRCVCAVPVYRKCRMMVWTPTALAFISFFYDRKSNIREVVYSIRFICQVKRTAYCLCALESFRIPFNKWNISVEYRNSFKSKCTQMRHFSCLHTTAI